MDMEQSYYKSESWLPKAVVRETIKDIVSLVKPRLKKKISDVSVLDVGCGYGEYSVSISRYVKNVVGVEPFEQAYKYACKYSKGRNIKFYHNKIEEYKTREKFDLVLSLTTLEHMPDADASFKNIFKLTSKGGLIYLTAPNKLWPYDNHYSLPFLTWLPVPVANFYVRITGRGVSYEDSAYSKTYFGLIKFLDQFPCKYKFILPNNNAKYLGCGTTGSFYSVIKSVGIWMISNFSFFWVFSKGFAVLIEKT